jgi:hypothetical protein
MADYMLMDFNGPTLQNEDWVKTQPAGTTAMIIDDKTDSGLDTYSLAVGAGRNGTNALRITCDRVWRTDPKINNGQPFLSDNLPGCFIKKIRITGNNTGNNTAQNFNNDGAYFVPRGVRANRLNMWLKFPSGYRVQQAAKGIDGKTPYGNFVVGTYHYDPGKVDGTDQVVESDNYHFYYRVHLRHDLANTEWVHVSINEMPQHQRGLSSYYCPNDLTLPGGSVWETLTRIYIDSDYYWMTPEIEYPYSILVDSIYTSYVEPDTEISIQIENFAEGQDFNYTLGTTNDLNVTVSNSSNAAISGVIYHRARYGIKPQLLENVNGVLQNRHNTLVTIPANSSRAFIFRIATPVIEPTPKSPYTLRAGVAFARSSTLLPVVSGIQPSLNDPYVSVCRDIHGQFSPLDGTVSSAFIRTVGHVGTPPLPNRPCSRGGVYYNGPLNSVITGTLPGSSSAGRPITFSRVSQQSSGGSISIASDGDFTFTPAAGFSGSFFFRYKLNDGLQDSLTYGSWVYATDGAPPTPPPPVEPPSVQSKLFMANGKFLMSPNNIPLGY